MARTSQTATANQHSNNNTDTDTDPVFRVHVCLDGGPRSGLPLDTGFASSMSFSEEHNAIELADDIRENPMEYYAAELQDYDGSLKVEVNKDTPLAARQER